MKPSQRTGRVKLTKVEQEELFHRADAAEDAGQYRSAFRLFLRGAKSGQTAMMSRLALCYGSGIGVRQNLELALEWDLLAYRKGGKHNALSIALDMRALGRWKDCLKWLERASANGDPSANLELALYYWRNDEPIKARDYARLALNAQRYAQASQLEREWAYWLLYGLESVGKRATKEHPVFKNYPS